MTKTKKMNPLRPWKDGVRLGGSASFLPASSSSMAGRGIRRGKINETGWELPIHQIYAFRKKRHEYCLCIPVMNEGDKFKKQLAKLKPYNKLVDIIVLDWGSTDGSTDKNFLKHNQVRALIIKESPGRQGTQFRMGFAYALKELYVGIITMDGNNKDSPEAIPNFIKELEKGYDYIQGSRFVKGGKGINTPLSRYLGVRFILSPLLSLAAWYWYSDITNAYRAFSRRYLLHPSVQPFRNIFISYEMLLYLTVRATQIGLKTKEIPVIREYPKGEIPTKIKGWRGNLHMIITAIKVATNYYHPKD